MKTKTLLIALLMLIPLLCTSQEGTDNKVVLDFEIGKFIALDLEELDRLTVVDSVNTVKIENLNKQIVFLEETTKDKSDQINSLLDTTTILNAQLEAEKLNKPKSKWLTWTLAVIGAFGTGYVLSN